MPFDSYRVHEVPDEVLAALDYCYEQGWTDGLPVVPPVIDRVEETLGHEGRPPEVVIATHPATGLQLTIHAAAVNAVMAGCLPEYFPVLIAAFEAMDKPEFNFHGSTASTGGSAPLLIVSGPVADDIGMNADVNLFGPGNRANFAGGNRANVGSGNRTFNQGNRNVNISGNYGGGYRGGYGGGYYGGAGWGGVAAGVAAGAVVGAAATAPRYYAPAPAPYCPYPNYPNCGL